MKFIEKLDYTADLNQMNSDLDKVISELGWLESKIVKDGRTYPPGQIGLNYRIDAEYPWYDASGSLYDTKKNEFIDKETSFTEWNPIGEYTKTIIEKLKKSLDINFGRIRYMRLMPKTGLSVHQDFDVRYHYVLKTNDRSFFGLAEPMIDENGVSSARCYNIPADGHFYRIDTRRNHFVYNGGWEPRIHLVFADARHDQDD
jgi:hypothetical protein